MDWIEIEEQRRWMPIGRAADPKAPAVGYRSNDPSNWLTYPEVQTRMSGLNFHFVDGLFGIDLDYKPAEGEEEAVERGRQRLSEIRSGLEALKLPGELSFSGLGMHYFAMADETLLAEIRGNARIKVTLAAGRGGKDVAAAELFGGGSAYIAVTGKWIGDEYAPTELPVLTLETLRRLLPEWGEESRRNPRLTPQRGYTAAREGTDEAERLLNILRQCPVPQDYDSWLKAISAAKAGGISLEDIDAWCSGGSKYRPGEVAEKWDSTLDDPGPGWIITYARRCGVDVPRSAGRQYGSAPAKTVSGEWVTARAYEVIETEAAEIEAEVETAASGIEAAMAEMAKLSAEQKAESFVPYTPPIEAAVPAAEAELDVDQLICACGNLKYSVTAARCTDCASNLIPELAAFAAEDAAYEPDPDWPARNSAAFVARRDKVYDPDNRAPWCDYCADVHLFYHRVDEGFCRAIRDAADEMIAEIEARAA